jgi:folylpolyglutamate synthase/dihydropteroate synthase
MKNVLTDKVEDALEVALNSYHKNSAIIAAGSIFIAGAIKDIWGKRIARER